MSELGIRKRLKISRLNGHGSSILPDRTNLKDTLMRVGEVGNAPGFDPGIARVQVSYPLPLNIRKLYIKIKYIAIKENHVRNGL